MEHDRGRIVIVSASVGAGHHTASEELALRLRRQGFRVDCHDFMQLLPGSLGRASLKTHHLLMRRAPWVYGALFGLGNRFRVTTTLAQAMLRPVRAPMMNLLDQDVRLVVSTYPLASQVLGTLRARGLLAVPVVTYVTDFATHRHWVAPGIDAHLTAHRVGADQAQSYGGRRPRTVGALVSEGFTPPDEATRERARASFGLPPGRLALVVAGSWGVGEVEATVADVARTGVATPVVACGRNDTLRRRLTAAGVHHVLGWVKDMPTLMQAVDVLIENAGGLMVLEGMACGLPVVTYRPIAGHGRENAAALERAGVSVWVTDRRRLGPTLVELTSGPTGNRQHEAAREMFTSDAARHIAVMTSDTAVGAASASAIWAARERENRRRRWRRTAVTSAAVGTIAAAALVGLLARRTRPARRSSRMPLAARRVPH